MKGATALVTPEIPPLVSIKAYGSAMLYVVINNAYRIWLVWLLEVDAFAISKIMTGTYLLVAVSTRGNLIVLPHWERHAASTMACYPKGLHYPGTELRARLAGDTFQFLKHWFDKTHGF